MPIEQVQATLQLGCGAVSGVGGVLFSHSTGLGPWILAFVLLPVVVFVIRALR